MSRTQLKSLIDLIELVVNAVSVSDDFSYSGWKSKDHALAEMDEILEDLREGTFTVDAVAMLFAPTGPLQELSMSNGWEEAYLSIAEQFDHISGRSAR
ncbi:hypothetical protein [Pontixanthobacter sp. CEM42]|uniref:hypothetical protein n=1 Tax=Pontixanthobacter sp. CEM42 TaxID=2792077 RepID=UPI001ADF6FF2|nr:hypothetical protein [Pontixanthobacter sp. CEM42]